MTDLVFSAPTIEQAFQDAVTVLGISGSELAYVVLERPEPDSGRPARIAVITQSGHAPAQSDVVPERPEREERGSVWPGLVAALQRELDVTVERDDDGDDVQVRLEARGNALDVELLEAAVHLLERVAARESGGARVVVRSETLRHAREGYLCDLAHELAEEVRRDGEPRVVPCHNSFERRIVHVALSDVDGIRTASEGEGARRQLVIFPSSTTVEEGASDEPQS
jgi:spoIIIJ-associated protein